MANRDAGVALIVVGVLLMAFGIFFWPVCGIGILLLIIGIVLTATGGMQPSYYYPQQPMYPYAPQAPPGATPAPGPQAPPACPVCGSALTWVPQYARWYCGRCQAYR